MWRMKSATRRLTIACLFLGLPTTLRSQEPISSDLLRECQAAQLPDDLAPPCRDVAAGIELLQPEVGIALVGGNPVLGTASPIGARFRLIPRMQFGARINFVFAELPDVSSYPDTPGQPVGTRGLVIPSPQLDLSIGLFKGLTLAETLGGLFAVELLGSIGAVILPAGAGFKSDATGYGLGARIGLLRESFTAPGISVTGLYNWTDRFQYGDVERGDLAQFGMDLKVASIRAGLSKSISSLALALTLGYDDYSSDVDFALASTSGAAIPVVTEDEPLDFGSQRWSAFVDLAYVVLFVSIVAEAGWQEAQTLALSTGQEIESGNFFGAIGLKLSM